MQGMNDTPIDLGVPAGHVRRLVIGWLTLGLAALIASGVYSVLLVLSRTPGVQEWIPLVDFFRTALVVHVDLSVVIWFLAFAGVFWSLNSVATRPAWDWAALVLFALGTLVIAVAPFAGAQHPLMNNYVPVLRDPIFFVGLGLVGVAFVVLVVLSLVNAKPLRARGSGPLNIGILVSTVAAAVAVVALLWSWLGVGNSLEDAGYYEVLFWGSGHVIQFTHTVLLLVAWLWLTQVTGGRLGVSPTVISALFILAGFPALLALPLYLSHEVLSPQHRIGFALLMKYGGLTSIPLGVLVAVAALRVRWPAAAQRPVRAALLSSIGLFAVGGVLGFMIEGVNVVIPAHYHGSIVGVTLAFMGVTYHLLPQLGFRPPAPRLGQIQPYVYGGGQLMHILGLAWSGGYGVQRKTAGAAQGLDNLPEIAGMAMMGLGGLIAIIGGLLFLVVAIRSMWPPSPQPARSD
jgi:hypothetical protein